MAAAAVEVGGQGRLVEVEPAETVGAERRPAAEEKVFRAYDPDQVLLLAPVLQEWLPEGHLADFVSDLVELEALDLSAIYADYEEARGYPPYDPRLMVKLLLMATRLGSFSRASWSGRAMRTWRCGCSAPTSTRLETREGIVVVIPQEIREALVEHSLRERPNEACGLVVIEGGVARRYEPGTNLARQPVPLGAEACRPGHALPRG